MNRENIIKLAREAGLKVGANISGVVLVGSPAEIGLAHLTIDELERFAALVAAAEREACGRVKAAKPRKLKSVGRGMLLDEQQFCFDKGWREGAASVRAAIRARGQA